MTDINVELIPVLDIRNGVVVRGVAGQRDLYRPIESNLVQSADPCEVLAALTIFEPRYVYVADLDGIERGEANLQTLSEMAAQSDAKICVDSGVGSTRDVEKLLELGVSQVVLGLESLPSFDWLADISAAIDPQHLIFSVDLKRGIPMQFPELAPLLIVEQAVELGVSQFIVLDLAGVGVGQGIPTLSLCSEIRQRFPKLGLWTGGGVNKMEDVTRAADSGVNGVLVASALHDGRITPESWQTLSGPQ